MFLPAVRLFERSRPSVHFAHSRPSLHAVADTRLGIDVPLAFIAWVRSSRSIVHDRCHCIMAPRRFAGDDVQAPVT